MKKSRFLALALVVAVALMGAGYAYWTDTLTINNTVSTGEMNVRFTEASATNVETDTDYITGMSSATYDDAANQKTIGFTLANLYPGASIDFDAVFVNDGTIPVVLDPITVDATGNTADLSKFLVTGSVEVEGLGTLNILPSHNKTLANVIITINNYIHHFRLEPTKEVIMDLNIQLDPNLTLDEEENVTAVQNYTLNFQQHNK